MADETQSVFEAALALPEEQRAALVQLLLESLPPDLEGLPEDELLAELDRRRADAERGAAGAVPWSDLRGQE